MNMSPPELAISSSKTPCVRSADDIRAWMLSEIALALKVDVSEIDSAAALDSLGVGSLAAITMTGALSQWLDRDLPATMLWDYVSIDALAAGLANANARTSPRTWPGIVNLQPEGDERPIFFFPGIGGHPVTFAPLAAQLGLNQPSYGIVVPGLDGGESPLNCMKAIAAATVTNLRRVQPAGPYQLAGYSFGGLLAYEAAQQLAAAGETVSIVAIYDQFTSDGKMDRPAWQRLGVHAYLFATSSHRVRYLRDRLKSIGASMKSVFEKPAPVPEPAADSSELMVKGVTDANYQAAGSYVPQPYSGAVVLFRATERPFEDNFCKLDLTGGWGALARGGVRVIDLPGNHFDILSAHRSAAAADALAKVLAHTETD